MPFVVPEFPLTCEIFNGPWLGKTLRVSAVPCNLGLGKRSLFFASDYLPGGSQITSQLLLPAGTDVRSQLLVANEDVVEVPSGSSRWYLVTGVEDAGKGFPNEHRIATLTQISQLFDPVKFAGAIWPVPMP